MKLAVCLAAALAALGAAAAAPAAPIGVVCTNGTLNANVRTFDVQASSGHIQTPDGNSILMWSFAPDPGTFQSPGPILCANQGEVVTVHLRNTLAEDVSIVFPGQTAVAASGGNSGLFTRVAPPGGTVTYSFTAGAPGTYLYESGTNVDKQIEMGLYGALIVRPAMGSDYAYNDATTRFDPAREYLLLLHDIDPALHSAVERSQPYDLTTKRDRYFTINGRSFPDTIADNGVPWLSKQPYGALVQVTPATPSSLPALIRYANAGLSNHPMHPHGNHLRVIGRDGRLLRGPASEDTSFENFTRTIGSGQTYDLLFKWVDREQWKPANPVPVAIPGYRNLVFKDKATWYSGSPYLGYRGTLPAGVSTQNQCGEYYYPWHSHALNEFTNFNEGFGGMATLLRVDSAQSFAVSAAPVSQSVARPGSTTYAVKVTKTKSCFNGAVVLAVSGLPASTTATFSPATIPNASGTSTLTVQTTSTTPAGSSTLTITGTSGSEANATTVGLTVAIPTTVTVVPSSVVVEPSSGTVSGGTTFANLAADDALYFSVNSTTSGFTRVASWYGVHTGIPNSVTSLAITYKGKNAPSCSRTVSVRNFTTGSWTTLNGPVTVGAETQLTNLVPPGTLANYVSGTVGNGAVWVRVRCTKALSSFVASGNLMKVVHG